MADSAERRRQEEPVRECRWKAKGCYEPNASFCSTPRLKARYSVQTALREAHDDRSSDHPDPRESLGFEAQNSASCTTATPRQLPRGRECSADPRHVLGKGTNSAAPHSPVARPRACSSVCGRACRPRALRRPRRRGPPTGVSSNRASRRSQAEGAPHMRPSKPSHHPKSGSRVNSQREKFHVSQKANDSA